MQSIRTKWRPAPGAIWLGCAAALIGSPGVASAAGIDCGSLTGVVSDSATITSAAMVAPPATIGGAAVTVPFCRVHGVARPSGDSEIKFEVWLPPAAAWTGRMKVDGTGGYSGATPYPRLAIRANFRSTVPPGVPIRSPKQYGRKARPLGAGESPRARGSWLGGLR